MSRMKPLPEAVRSSVRSGVIVYDLTRVVEELVFNSLDAGATKVSVSVGIGTCSVKVEDNGSGVDRDGLVLLGERYATSKHDQLADVGTSNQNFGFRGEALCSISDVSLLEIISKAHGRPHGYRKVMKGCKCLYLGIDDHRHDVGTTVLVRDLFYNQPVRRKHMQSSPKKVLHLVKKCVLRIALVHPRVSFRVADIESEEELLSTSSSPSPLPLLSTNFGIEAVCSLHEIKASEHEFKLSGFLSGPFGILSPKAIQYIYINSRFVCKGPIHRLLNHLAADYWDDQKFNIGAQNEKRSRKRSRPQICPTFILKLSCPRSYYDITFEPLKTSVEFTDWGPVLAFIQNTITLSWSENISNDLPVNGESGRKRYRSSDGQAAPAVPCSRSQKLIRHCKNWPALRESLSSCQKSNGDAPELHKHKTDALFEDCEIESFDASEFHCGVTTNEKIHNHMPLSGDYFSDKDDILVKELSTKDTCNKDVANFLDSQWRDESFEMDDQMKMSIRSPLHIHSHEYSDDADINQLFRKPTELSCLTRRGLQDVGSSHLSKVGSDFGSYDFRTQHNWVDHDEGVDIEEEYDTDLIYKKSLSRKDRLKSLWSFSRCKNQHDRRTDSNISTQDLRSSLIAEECSREENYLLSKSPKHITQSDGNKWSSTSEWSPLVPTSLFPTEFPDVNHFFGEGVCCEYGKSTTSDYFPDGEGDYCNFNLDTAANSWVLENCTDFSSDLNFYASPLGDISEVRGHRLDDSIFANCSSVFPDEKDWLLIDSCRKNTLPKVSDPLDQTSLLAQSNRNKCGRTNKETMHNNKGPRRSHSAPPFYRRRRKFFALNNLLNMKAGRTDSPAINNDSSLPETSNLLHQQQSFGQCHSPASYAHDSLSVPRLKNKDFRKKGQLINSCIFQPVEDSTSKETRDVLDSSLKWRNNCPQTAGVMNSQITQDHDSILDVSSGILHLAGCSLVPSSIDKNCLKDAKVLQQVDRKFIPIVAGRILAVIDQHAADERIRLEELRQKVLSREMKQVTYLEAEQELVLPEIGYQLLHNYLDQIENWGWICSISGPGTRSFGKNLNVLYRQPAVAKLVAVPCILGVNLTDVDLLEFLQQLADTDGSSTVPPSVHRILNNKACRGAIMFGDTLLPSECSLIVEELKQTSLCFQCAHGRPTTVPLVNLDSLHKQIDKLGLHGSGTREMWQGLCRHEISLERAASRLTLAMD